MSKESAPQTQTTPTEIPDTYIQDKDLALEVAHAEKPHTLAGIEATETGHFNAAGKHFADAEAAGQEAAKTYINEEQERLDELRRHINGGEAETTTSFEARVESAKQALAERYGVPAEDFSLVSYEAEGGETKHTVFYTGLSGIDLGNPTKDYDEKRSFNSLMADDSHIVAIDGEKVDTRTLSEAAYFAFINQEIAKGTNPLPDSNSLELWTVTWLPGEKADREYARCGDVNEGQPYSHWNSRGGDDRVMRFRPAVEVSEA